MLKDFNLEGYLYTHRTESMGKKKKNSIFTDLITFKGKKSSKWVRIKTNLTFSH